MLVRDNDYNWLHYSEQLDIDKQSSKIVVEDGQIIVTLAAEVYINNPSLFSIVIEKQMEDVETVYNQDGDELVAVCKDTSDTKIGQSPGPF